MAYENFTLSMFDLLWIHDPYIVILVQPKVSSKVARGLIRRSRLNQIIVAKAVGSSGGI